MTSTIRHQGMILAILLVAAFMGQFDFFVVNVAAPAVQEALGASEAGLELIVGGYAFAYASGLIAGGRLGDMYGHRRMYLWGLMLFGGDVSAVRGECIRRISDIRANYAGFCRRGHDSAGAGVHQCCSAGRTTRVAMAWYGVATGVGSIAGQILGGWFIHADLMGLGWRVIFLINVPIAALTFVATLLIIPGSRRPEAPTIDAPGAVGISVSLAAMLLPFVLGRQNGWPVWMWGGPVIGAILLLIVIRMENRRAARGGDPVLDTKVIVIPSLARGLIASVLFMTFFASFMFRLTILLQQGEHIEPLYAGLVFAPSGVTFALSSLLMRGWVAQNRERAVRTGACVTMIGLLIAVLGLTVEALPTVPLIVAAVCATGFGNGLVLPTLIGLALCDVPLTKSGVASGTMTASQQFAASAGVALLGTLYFACSASAGHEHAMAWTLVVDIVLLIAVILVAGLPRRSAIEG